MDKLLPGMGRLTKEQQAVALETRGRWGRPSSYGRAHCGFNLLGADDSLAGIYRKATFADGRAISIRPFYWPRNPQTPTQQARRELFQAGVSAYRALTPEQLADINTKGKARGLTGYNYFLSKWLRAE